jgi:hypothetical protein
MAMRESRTLRLRSGQALGDGGEDLQEAAVADAVFAVLEPVQVALWGAITRTFTAPVAADDLRE